MGRYVGFTPMWEWTLCGFQPYSARLFTSLATPPTTAPRPPATVANPHIVCSLASKQTHIQSHSPTDSQEHVGDSRSVWRVVMLITVKLAVSLYGQKSSVLCLYVWYTVVGNVCSVLLMCRDLEECPMNSTTSSVWMLTALTRVSLLAATGIISSISLIMCWHICTLKFYISKVSPEVMSECSSVIFL